MSPQPSPPPDQRIGEFERKHRSGLVTLVFTDMAGSTALKQNLGDRASAEFFRRHHESVRETLRRFVTGREDSTAWVWEAARAEQVAAWRMEEQSAAQHLAALQRDRTVEQQRQRLDRTQDQGAIKRWLMVAPIALATGQSGAEGVDVEQIEGEARLRPIAGDTAVTKSGNVKWQEVKQEDYLLDFNLIVGSSTPHSVAYSACYIRSESAQSGLRMLVGSDDEAKVYLNGKQIYRHTTGRSFLADQDIVPDVTLNAGLNFLMFKVVNEIGPWQGSLRFTDALGNPVNGIQVTLTP